MKKTKEQRLWEYLNKQMEANRGNFNLTTSEQARILYDYITKYYK